jgi:hypothetical protein
MAEKTLSELTEAATAANNATVFIETDAGPRRITRNNLMPGRGAFTEVLASQVTLASDRVLALFSSNGRPREISFQQLLFGNYGNLIETDDFTLVPNVHNYQIIELGEDLPDVVSTVTLDGGQAGIAGATFNLVNTRSSSITVTTANGITLYVEGTATDGLIGGRQAATIMVFENGTEAVFSGG